MILGQKILAGGASAPLTILSGTVNAAVITSAHNIHFEVWSDSGNSPVSQIGVDSASTSVSSTGEHTVTFSTPVDVSGISPFWIVQVADGGDVNYNRHTSVAGTDVDGGDFEPSTSITNLVLGTTFVPRISILMSDGRRLGNRDTGSTAVGSGSGNRFGIRITPA
jgi:hypothetical protein